MTDGPGFPLKGVPAGLDRFGLGRNVLDDAEFPLMLLKSGALEHNLRLMAAYCRTNEVSLAPHGKTTMSPQLFERQLAAGAWAITVANSWQCRVARTFGVSRILIANELVDPAAIRWLAQEVRRDPSFDVYFYVDSVRGVEAVEEVYAGADLPPLQVLVELGYPGGRTGCRTPEQALEVAERASRSPATVLRGVSGFEGLMKAAPGVSMAETTTAFLVEMRRLVTRIHQAHPPRSGEELIVSAGGSAYFDRVIDVLGPGRFDFPVRTVLRSGCYVTHDSGMYEDSSPLAGRRDDPTAPRLEAALELWATVLSRPEPGLAILGFGKRDAPYDYKLPTPLHVRKRGERSTRPAPAGYEIFDLNDQHAFLRVPEEDSLAVGDQVVSGISHPCGAFDKWRVIPVVDDDYQVVDHVTSAL